VFEGILVGDVWLCSGQSNMTWLNCDSDHFAETMAGTSECEGVRLFDVAQRQSWQSDHNVMGAWMKPSPDEVAYFSAVAWHFGRSLWKETGIPQGLVHASVGSASIDSFMAPEWLEEHPNAEQLLEVNRQKFLQGRGACARQLRRVGRYDSVAAQLQQLGYTPAPNPMNCSNHVSSLHWKGMVEPMVPYAFSGMIWYQGEYECWRYKDFPWLLERMVKEYRKAFGSRDFPFYCTQLAPFSPENQPPHEYWREVQSMIGERAGVPRSATACTLDIGDRNDIHPKEKREVGRRLSLLARRDLYAEKDLVAEGPRVLSASCEDGQVRIKFAPETGALVLPKRADCCLEVIDASGQSVNLSQLKLESPYVLVGQCSLSEPVCIRHGWERWPENTLLTNEQGLPALVFSVAL
jgi:sialate O-acetylesterase